ncbi:NACHT domain-containing protein [Streptomyces cyaneofuscatus]|uniref:NACHT domain-containing protein n=1 Tax=Streptomyces cyaneofuscatus TaxID=66883 RepID=UPI0036D9AF45
MHDYRQAFTARTAATFAVSGLLVLSLAALLAQTFYGWSPSHIGRPVCAATAVLTAAALAALHAVRVLPATGDAQDLSTPALADRLADICVARERHQFGQMVETGAPMDLLFRRLRDSAGHPRGSSTSRLTEIASYYRGCETERLLFLGEGGSGKTVILVHLLLQMLDERAPGGLVAWRFSLSRWDTSRKLSAWMAEEIYRDTRIPLAQAQDLVTRGLILPLLDGLDEMDPPHTPFPTRAAEVVEQLNKAERFDQPIPFVLTCRTETHDRLVSRGARLADTVAVQILRLSPKQVQRHIKSVADEERWADVLAHLEKDANGRLAQYLSLPWRLAMAVVIYDKKSGDGYARDLSDLTAPGWSDDTPPVTVGRFVEELLSRPAVAGRREPTRRTLATLAAYLHDRRCLDGEGKALPGAGIGKTLSGVDLVVHELWPAGGPHAPRYVTAALSVLLWAPAAAAVLWAVGHLAWPFWLKAAVCGVLGLFPAYSVHTSLAQWPHPRNVVLGRFRTPTGIRRLSAAAVVGLLVLILLAATGAPGFTVAYAAMFTLIFGSGSALAVRDGADVRVLATVALTVGLVFGLATRLALGSLGPAGGMLVGTGGGGIALVLAVRAALRGGAEPHHVRNPVFEDFIANDIRTACVSGAMLAAIIAVLLQFLPLTASALQVALMSVAGGFSLGFGFVADAWRRHIALLICCRGALAPRLAHVLARAHDAGLLRRAGIAYQFRHLDLRDHFAALSAELTGQRPSGRGARFRPSAPSLKNR